MKYLLNVLFLFVFTVANAQTTLKPKVSAPNRESTWLESVSKGKFLKLQTAETDIYRGKGKFLLYSSDMKQLASLDYQLPFKIRHSALITGILNEERMIRLTADVYSSPYRRFPYVFTQVTALGSGITRQDYDPKTLKPIGSPQIIHNPSMPYSTLFWGARSLDGNWFAIVVNEGMVTNQIKYKLFNNQGEVFERDIILNGCQVCAVELNSVVMADNGDIAFVYYSDGQGKTSTTQLVFIQAATQKVFIKKLGDATKIVSTNAAITFTKDGGVVVAVAYGNQGSDVQTSVGVLVKQYSANGDLVQSGDVKYSSEVLSESKTTERYKMQANELFAQTPVNLHAMENGGYVLVTEQAYFDYVKTSDYKHAVYNFVLAIGFNDKLEEQYQYVIRKVDEYQKFHCCDPFESVAIGNKVYVLHNGDDKSAKKNTPDEFDVFVTWWDHGQTKPQAVEIERPNRDDRIHPSSAIPLSENKLLLNGRIREGNIDLVIDVE